MKTNGLDATHYRQDGVTTKKKQWHKIGLPPHIAWPMFVVGLLVLGVGLGMWIVFASMSDGGAQVVENYYEKAVGWNDRNQLIQQSNATGWVVDLEYITGASVDRGSLEIRFKDAEGEPVTDLQGVIKTYRPQTTKIVSELTLVSVPERPGVYRQLFPSATAGIWDFEISVERDDFRFLKVIRKEF